MVAGPFFVLEAAMIVTKTEAKETDLVETRLKGEWVEPYRAGMTVRLILRAYRAMFRRGWVYPGRFLKP